MARQIHCKKCSCYLGEIRDAKLKKGIVNICGKCYDEKIEKPINYDSDFGGIFKDIFGKG